MMFGLKTFRLRLGSILFFLFFLFSQVSFSQTGVANALKEAYNSKNIDSLNSFIQAYPNETRYIDEALRIIDQLAFEEASQQNSIEAYEAYIEKYPNAVQTIKAKQWIELNSKKIKQEIEESDYNKAKQVNTIEAYSEFIKKYPKSKYYNYAKESIHKFEYKQNISSFSVEQLIRFLTKYPNNPNSNYIFDTLQVQTLRYLSYEGLVFISNNTLFNIDIEEFQDRFAFSYTQSGETKAFEKLFRDFPHLKSNKNLYRNYQDALAIETLLKLPNIDTKTYNSNKKFFTSIKNDKSLQLLKKYIKPFIEQKKIANITKVLEPVEDDFRVKQFQQTLFQTPAPEPHNKTISFNQDSTIKLIVESAPSGYGKSDIYVSLKEDNVFQTPFILPKPINSIYREISPIINNEGDVLYFYSENGMNQDELDLYISFRADKNSWTNWSIPLKVNTIDTKNAKKDFERGYVINQNSKPMEALVNIADVKTGERLFVSQTNPKTGYFAYPKQSKPINILSINKGYISKYYTQEKDLVIRQDLIDDLYSKRMILTIESIFSDESPDKLTKPAENYLNYLAKSLEGSKYVITISVHTQKGYKTMNEEALSWHQATLIKDKLIENGVSFQNVIAAGYGNNNPLIGWEGKSRIEIGFMIIGSQED